MTPDERRRAVETFLRSTRRARVEVAGKASLLVDVIHVESNHATLHPVGWSLLNLRVALDDVAAASPAGESDGEAWQIALDQAGMEESW